MLAPPLLGLFLVTAACADNKLVFSVNKGVTVHLFEWKWTDIAQECENFLGPQGFAGVQISPPNENTADPPGTWRERYNPKSYKLDTRSGTEQELQEMINRCNNVGVRVFADAVLNQMSAGGAVAEGNDVANVKSQQLDYLNKLIKMGIAGFRIDAVKHLWPQDMDDVFNKVIDLNIAHGFPPNTRPRMEFINEMDSIKWQQYSFLGLVTHSRFGNEIGDTFLEGTKDLNWLKSFEFNKNLLPDEVQVLFVDNHYTQRETKPNRLNYKKARPYKMAVAFMLAYPWGTPNLLSSYKYDTDDEGPPFDVNGKILSPEPSDDNIFVDKWTCEHRWRQIYNMVRFHNVVAGTDVRNWWDNGKDQIAFCRGKKGFIAFNKNENKLSENLQTCLPKGKYCDVISGSLVNNKCTGKTVEVRDDGLATVEINAYDLNDQDINNDGVLALHVKAKILETDTPGDGAESTGEKIMTLLQELRLLELEGSDPSSSSSSSSSNLDQDRAVLRALTKLKKIVKAANEDYEP